MGSRTLNLGIPAGQYPEFPFEGGRCLVVGGARCVWDDLRRVKGHWHTVCVNDIAMHFPGPVNHLYSNNNPYLEKWRNGRRDQYVKKWGPVGITHSNHVGGQVTWPWPGSGTSALGAVFTALMIYDEVVLIGVPLDDTPHYFEPPWTASSFSRQVPFKGNGTLKYWASAKDNVFQGRVTSMSGRTKDLLGEPK